MSTETLTVQRSHLGSIGLYEFRRGQFIAVKLKNEGESYRTYVNLKKQLNSYQVNIIFNEQYVMGAAYGRTVIPSSMASKLRPFFVKLSVYNVPFCSYCTGDQKGRFV